MSTNREVILHMPNEISTVRYMGKTLRVPFMIDPLSAMMDNTYIWEGLAVVEYEFFRLDRIDDKFYYRKPAWMNLDEYVITEDED